MTKALTQEEKIKRTKIRQQELLQEIQKLINGIIYRQCIECGEWLTLDNYYFQEKKYANGEKYKYINRRCISCDTKAGRRWALANPDKKNESVKKDQKKPQRQKYLKELSKKRRIDGKYKEWQRSESGKESAKRSRMKREMNKSHDISKQEWEGCLDFFNHACAYCGMTNENAKHKYNNYLHKEHVDHEGANDLSNCVPACKGCNSSKNISKFEEWYNENNPIFSQERKDKICKWLNEGYTKHKMKRKPS